MTCAHCLSHQATIRELRDELAAWRSSSVNDREELVTAERFDRWRRRLRVPGGEALLLMALADHSPKPLSRLRLMEVRTMRPGVKFDEDADPKVIDVRLHKARRALAALGWTGQITNSWGVGWFLSEEDAASLRVLAGEAA